MVGVYVEIIKVSECGMIYLSNGDKLFLNIFNDTWAVDYKRSHYVERLINTDKSSCKTFQDAIESYQNRTGNCLVGPMDAIGVEHILSSPGLSWVAYKPLEKVKVL
jgi:hypothetical protein